MWDGLAHEDQWTTWKCPVAPKYRMEYQKSKKKATAKDCPCKEKTNDKK
jgi:hypothetical protein